MRSGGIGVPSGVEYRWRCGIQQRLETEAGLSPWRSTRGRSGRCLLAICFGAGGLITLAPRVGAAPTTCQARNVTKDLPSGSDLQIVIDAADPGDTIAVRSVCVGNFTISKDLTLIGRSTARVRRPSLDADGAGTVLIASAQVLLSNLRIRDGLATNGGGIVDTGTLVLENTVVRENKATDTGGGVYVGATGALTLSQGSWVAANRADHGGGIANLGTATLNDTSSVRNNSVIAFPHYRDGGGVYNAGLFTMNDSASVRGNHGHHSPGAGIYSSSGTVILNDASSVRDNSATYGSSGGGIYNAKESALVLNDTSSVRRNTAFGNGGGISNRGSVTLNDSSSVRGNTVYIRGGGMYNFGLHAVVTLNGASSVTRNRVFGSGGGIYNAATVTLNGASSVSENRATGTVASGGGIRNFGGSLVMNDTSSVRGNRTSGNGGGIDNSDGATSMQATALVTKNIVDIDRDGEGLGGGIFSCSDTLTGAVDGGNVDGNHLERATGTENNIASCP